jgi:serine/threonine protein kinase
MSLCINPQCSKPENSDKTLFCQSCGSELLLEGRYRVTQELGEGGFGKTYEVSDVRSSSFSVLKVLIKNQSKAVELFQREAEVLKMLNHPGIPKVEPDNYFIYFPRSSQQPLHCLVMEKIEGMDLCEYLKHRDERSINEKLAVQWLKEIVYILQLIHDQNFFHRDIKPPNIMLRTTGHLALIDFGAAREATQTYYFAHQQGNVTGIISAGYTPNEQMNGQAVPQSDFFALGRTFAFLLTGKDPTKMYDASNGELLWRSHAGQISPRFADLIDQMMAHFPGDRPVNTREILHRLAEIEQVIIPPRQSYQPPQPQNIGYQSPPPAYQQGYQPTLVTPSKPNISWDFWWQWLVASITGVVVVIVLMAADTSNAGFYLFLGTIVLGIFQWLVLRRWVSWVSKTGWWVLATTLGFIGGGLGGVLVGAAVVNGAGETAGGFIFFVAGYGLLGTIQWLLLRQWVSSAHHWIWVNVVSAFVAAFTGFAIVGDSESNHALVAVGLMIGFVVFNGITGVVLMRLLRNPISKP